MAVIDFEGADEWDWTDTVEVTITYTTSLPRALVEAYNDLVAAYRDPEANERAVEAIDACVGELVHITSPEVKVV